MSDQIEVREKAQVSSEISYGRFLTNFCSVLAVVGFLTFPAHAQMPWQAGETVLPKPVDPSANLAPEGGCKPEIDKKFTTQQVGDHLYEHGGFISGGKQCYAVKIFTPTNELVADLLVAGIHGDGGNGVTTEGPNRMEELLQIISKQPIFNKTKIALASIAREGYSSNGVGHSSGERPYGGMDSYHHRYIQNIMEATDNLGVMLRARKKMGIGTSGGALYWAIGTTMDHRIPLSEAVIISCPCDIPAWESFHRYRSSGGISPVAIAARTNKETKIALIYGTKDWNTFPELSENYAAKLREIGVEPKMVKITKGDHDNTRFNPLTIDHISSSIEANALK